MFIRLSTSRCAIWSRLLATAVAAVAFALSVDAQAAPETFVVTDDGYGVMECLKEKSDCGRIVADAWCEAHGHGPAQAYGAADDMTATISAATSARKAPAGALLISCAD